MDRKPRSRVRSKKGARDRLIRLALAHPEWAIGFEDETWWSRFERPSLHSWEQAGRSMRLFEKEAPKDDPDPKALSCYGLFVPKLKQTWLRFVDGRPVSAVTTRFLEWCCEKLRAAGKKALLLVWDNASWHTSEEVRRWIGEHNRRVKRSSRGVRIVACLLPKRSPWLNPIEPKWVHGKRRVVEADGLLTARELADRVCAAFNCPHHEHLSVAENVA
jgi:DDE superfamily endonuclease